MGFVTVGMWTMGNTIEYMLHCNSNEHCRIDIGDPYKDLFPMPYVQHTDVAVGKHAQIDDILCTQWCFLVKVSRQMDFPCGKRVEGNEPMVEIVVHNVEAEN